jgi:hypothetical protein
MTPIPTHALLLLSMLLPACGDKTTETAEPAAPDHTGLDTSAPVDADEDGYGVDADCDDTDPAIYPGADELCDGVDNNCNGVADEGFADTDMDDVADCADAETCDGADNDGDGAVDEDFADGDGDALADCLDSEECDGLDNDGDGRTDEGYDGDGDGWLPCGADDLDPEELDCDDSDSAVSPGASEVGDSAADEDCDGLIDEGGWAAGDLVLSELLVNPEAHSDPDGEWIELFNASGRSVYLNGLTLVSGGEEHKVSAAEPLALDPGGYALLMLSGDTASNGGLIADYVYDTVSLSNEGDTLTVFAGEVEVDAVTWDDGALFPAASGYSMSLDPAFTNAADNDQGGLWCVAPEQWGFGTDFGSPGEENPLCPTLDRDNDGFSGDEGDCDDADDTINPGAEEVPYDGIDNDCDPDTLDDDLDQDGFDAVETGGLDCDDTDPDTNPDGVEICDPDNSDEDCDGLSDDDDDDVTGTDTWYPDSDSDSFGDPDGAALVSCDQPLGYVLDDNDCDDDAADINPGEAETPYDGIDNDCDPDTLDDDLDQDGYNDLSTGGIDCDDEDPLTYPGAPERCDGTSGDEDCDGVIDEDLVYEDNDRDGFIDCDDDCDGDNPLVHPYAWEDTSDGIDNDCDGEIDGDDTDAATALSLSDDSVSLISFADFTFNLCGTDYTQAYVSSNGRVMLGTSYSTDYSESASGHYSYPSLAGLYDDLNPSSGGTVYWIEYEDAVGVYFRDVHEYSTTNDQTFSMIFLGDGRMMLEYEEITVSDGLAGWACGSGSLGSRAVDLTNELLDLPEDSLGIGKGTETSVYQLFTSGNDLDGKTFMFCVQSGTDADGDGWTGDCGDPDDSDASITP